MPQGSQGHHSRSPLSRVAKDKGAMARVANPYSEKEDKDYTVIGPGEEGRCRGTSEADTLVPGAVQHVRCAGYPSYKGVKKG